MVYKLKYTEIYGRGLYATKNIKKGTIITICEILVLPKHDTRVINGTELGLYTFVFDKTRDCLVLGDGEIFNHNIGANVSYKLIQKGNRKVMQFTATCNIKKGMQLFTDYRQDIDVDIKQYKTNLIDSK